MNYNFLGLDLATNPWECRDPLHVQLGQHWPHSHPHHRRRQPAAHDQVHDPHPAHARGPGAGSTKMMMWFMPLFSVYIAFIMPAALGVYWIAQSAFSPCRSW